LSIAARASQNGPSLAILAVLIVDIMPGRYPFTIGPDKSCAIKFAESTGFLPPQKIRTHEND
jgi:hypothetical protein